MDVGQCPLVFWVCFSGYIYCFSYLRYGFSVSMVSMSVLSASLVFLCLGGKVLFMPILVLIVVGLWSLDRLLWAFHSLSVLVANSLLPRQLSSVFACLVWVLGLWQICSLRCCGSLSSIMLLEL